ncbi:MAG TPA: lipopolysaccharide biosynthesis protein [Roseomonas sp.]
MSIGARASTRVAIASAWLVIGRFLARGFDLASLFVLGRLLGPSEFGVIATAMTLIYIVEAICELPVSQVLVRTPDLTPRLLDTAFTLSLLRGVFLALVIVALAFPFATFADDPHLVSLICVLGLAPAVRGLASPRLVIFARAIDFRREFLLDVAARFGTFIVSLIVALETHSYWALAAGTVTAPVVTMIISYVMAPYRPRLTLVEWRIFVNLLGWNTISQIFVAISWQIDRFILGGYAARADFGRFAVANDIAAMPYQTLVYPLIRPLVAGFSTVADDIGRLRAAYLKCCQAIALLGAPVFVGIAVLSDQIVHVALGAAWSDAGPLLAYFALSSVIPLLKIPFGSLVITINRAVYLVWAGISILVIKTAVVVVAFWYYGLYGVAVGRIIFEALGTFFSMYLMYRLVGLGIMQQLRAGARPFLCAALMGLCLWPITRSMPVEPVNSTLLLSMAGIVVLGAVIYTGSAALLWRLGGRPSGVEEIVLSWLVRIWSFMPWRRTPV